MKKILVIDQPFGSAPRGEVALLSVSEETVARIDKATDDGEYEHAAQIAIDEATHRKKIKVDMILHVR